jgi:hypothetical protein
LTAILPELPGHVELLEKTHSIKVRSSSNERNFSWYMAKTSLTYRASNLSAAIGLFFKVPSSQLWKWLKGNDRSYSELKNNIFFSSNLALFLLTSLISNRHIISSGGKIALSSFGDHPPKQRYKMFDDPLASRAVTRMRQN